MLWSNCCWRSIRTIFGTAALAAIFAPAAALAAPWAYNVQFGDLIRGDLATGRVEVVGPTGLGNDFFATALTEDGNGHFYALAGPFSLTWTTSDLYRIDAATGAAVLIAPFGLPEGSGLEIGPDGQLYLSAGSTLRQLDPDTGEEIRFIPLPTGGLHALATAGGALYGVALDGSSCHLDRLDPVGLTATQLLADVPCAYSMAGDAEGRVWLVSHGGGVITGAYSARIDVFDPETLEIQPWSALGGQFYDTTRTGFRSLAAVGPVGAVDVPAAGPAGLALLALALAGAGAIFLRR